MHVPSSAAVRAALLEPVLALLGMTLKEYDAARRDGLSTREIANDIGVDSQQFSNALREGRAAARAMTAN